VVDFKHTNLNNKEKLEKYVFQIKFYMYLLKDLGNVSEGRIVSTKTGEVINVAPPDESFVEEIKSKIEKYEKVIL